MNTTPQSTKYFLYIRKSTDEEDRQVLSLEAQLDECKEFAEREGIEIAETFVEKKTAKVPGRLIFNAMLDKIEGGLSQSIGILAWNPLCQPFPISNWAIDIFERHKFAGC